MLIPLLGTHPKESTRTAQSFTWNLRDNSPHVPQGTGQTPGAHRSHVHGEPQARVPAPARPRTERATLGQDKGQAQPHRCGREGGGSFILYFILYFPKHT